MNPGVNKKSVLRVYHRQLAEPDVVSTAVQQQIKNGVPVHYRTEETELNASLSTAREPTLARVPTSQSLEEQVLEVLASNHDIELQTLGDMSYQLQGANIPTNQDGAYISEPDTVNPGSRTGSDRHESEKQAFTISWGEKNSVNSLEVSDKEVTTTETPSDDMKSERAYTVKYENAKSDWFLNDGRDAPEAIIQSIYFTGHIGDRHHHAVENALLSAMCKATDETCNYITVELLDKSYYVDCTRNEVTGYTYHVTGDHVTGDAGEVVLTAEQRENFTAEVLRCLATMEVATGEEFGLYTGSVDDLRIQLSARHEEGVITLGGTNGDEVNRHEHLAQLEHKERNCTYGTQTTGSHQDNDDLSITILDSTNKNGTKWVSSEVSESDVYISSVVTMQFEKTIVADSPDVYFFN